MTHKDNVRNVYSILNAGRYDLFRRLWVVLATRRSEKDYAQMLATDLKKDASILELGCGTGINIKRVLESGVRFRSYTALDISYHMLKTVRSRYGCVNDLTIAKKDITQKPDPGMYDLVISSYVLSHIEEPSTVVNAHLRHLKKGGRMVLLFLTRPSWYIHFWFYPLLRLFAAKYVPEQEIDKMNGRKSVRKYSGGLITTVQIERGGHDL